MYADLAYTDVLGLADTIVERVTSEGRAATSGGRTSLGRAIDQAKGSGRGYARIRQV